MTEKQLQAWAPEEQAMNEIVEFAAEQITHAYQRGEEKLYIESLERSFKSFSQTGRRFYVDHMQSRIFKRTLELVRELQKQDDVKKQQEHVKKAISEVQNPDEGLL